MNIIAKWNISIESKWKTSTSSNIWLHNLVSYSIETYMAKFLFDAQSVYIKQRKLEKFTNRGLDPIRYNIWI